MGSPLILHLQTIGFSHRWSSLVHNDRRRCSNGSQYYCSNTERCSGDIAKDPDFGKKLVAAIADGGKQVVISTPSFGNAATVIESHHSDNTVLIAVGGNCASVLYNKIGGKLHTKEARWICWKKRWRTQLDQTVCRRPG